MAEGNARPQVHRVYINTYRVAELLYGPVRISNRETMANNVGSPDFTCNIRVPEPKNFELIVNGNAAITMSVYVGESFATQLIIRGGRLMFDQNYVCQGDVMTQTYMAAAPRHPSHTCRLNINSYSLLQRCDFRIDGGNWFTAVLHGRNKCDQMAISFTIASRNW